MEQKIITKIVYNYPCSSEIQEFIPEGYKIVSVCVTPTRCAHFIDYEMREYMIYMVIEKLVIPELLTT